MNDWWKWMLAFGQFMDWMQKSFADGKVNLQEMTDLVHLVAAIFGKKIEIEL